MHEHCKNTPPPSTPLQSSPTKPCVILSTWSTSQASKTKYQTLSQVLKYPTGDHQPGKMILPDDIHCLQNDVSDTSTSPLKIPNQLISGVCTIDQLHPTIEDDKLREPLISSLHSIQTVTWEQVYFFACSSLSPT